MTDDLERRLRALGTDEPPRIDGARLELIEQRVLASTARGDRRRVGMVLLAVAAVILLIGGIVLASGRSSNEPQLRFADGVTLEVPGAPVTPGEAGDALPDGTIIDVAAGGRAVVGDTTIGPGRYIVVDGEIRQVVTESSTVAPATVATTSPVRDATAPPDDGDDGDDDRGTRPTTTEGRRPSRPVDRPTDVTTTTTTTVTTVSTAAPTDRTDRVTTTTAPADRPTTTRVRDRRTDRSTTTTAATSSTSTSTSSTPSTSTTDVVRDRPPATRP